MKVEFIVYTFIMLLLLAFGILLTFKPKSVQEASMRLHTKVWFLSKTKYGKRILVGMAEDNKRKSFIVGLRINGMIFIFISILGLFILITEW
jgi:hypothetical protein